MKSYKFSFKDWNINKFLHGRDRMIITIIGAVAGYIVTENPALAGVAGAGADLLYALIEYWLKD